MDLRISLNDEEYEFVKDKPKGWVRDVVRRFIDVETKALTPDELVYLRDHGGTKGVIAMAKGEKTDEDYDAVTGIWRPKEHGGEVQPCDDESCDVCGRPLYGGICRNQTCSRCPSGETFENAWETPEGKKTRKGYHAAQVVGPAEYRRQKEGK